MQKRIVSILLPLCLSAFLPFSLSAEILPSGYYNLAQGKADSLLKSALHDTICGGERFHYGTWGYKYDTITHRQTDERYEGTWSFFMFSDRHSDGTVWDMYSPYVRYFPAFGESGCALQIEHCLPKSWWGDEDGCKRAYQDLYNLNPSDAAANNNKSNYPPGIVTKGDKFNNGVFKMDSKSKSQYGWACFEPADEYKGDFARAYFYMVTAYEDVPWVYGTSPFDAKNALTNDSYLEFQPWLQELLLDWHRKDPVSKKEIDRLDAISSAQHNRNPYIDYPELVEYIWGDKKGQTVDFTQLICTSSPEYKPQEDKTNLLLTAANTSDGGITLRWNDFQTTYSVDVYTLDTTGTNDTLINLPGVTKNLIEATKHGAIRGKVASNGTQAITMGSSSTDGTVALYNLQSLRKNELPMSMRFRASLYNTATSAKIEVYANTELIETFTDFTHDEKWYELPLPANTDSVRISSIGGSTSKRACLQSVFIIQGDEAVYHTSIEGFPQSVSTNRLRIDGFLTDITVNAQVQTAAGRVSNEITVSISAPTTPLPSVKSAIPSIRKVFQNNQIYIISPYSSTPLLLYSL